MILQQHTAKFFLTLLTLSAPLCAWGDDDIPEALPDPHAFFEEFVARYRIDSESKRYMRLRKQLVSAPAASDIDEDPPQLKGIVRHLRGESGVAFVTRPPGPPRIPRFSETSMKDIAKKAVELSNLISSTPLAPRVLPPCTEDGSERLPIELDLKGTKKLALVDMLFIDANNLPPDPHAAFGENVFLETYRPDPKNRAGYEAVGFGVTCLPTRIIISGKHSIRLWGEPALRNYDNNPNGKGRDILKSSGNK